MKQEHAITKDGLARGTTTSYVMGFVFSLALTVTAFAAVTIYNQGVSNLSHQYILGGIIVLAVVQLFVQLVFFLHLDRESKPRWNLMVAGFAATVVLILVLGSLWIMNNLNYHVDSPTPTDKAIIKDEGVHQ